MRLALRKSFHTHIHTHMQSKQTDKHLTHTHTCAEYPCIFVLCVLRCGIYTSVSVRVGYAKRSRFCTLARPPDDSNYPAVILPCPPFPALPFLYLPLSLTNRKLQQCCHKNKLITPFTLLPLINKSKYANLCIKLFIK